MSGFCPDDAEQKLRHSDVLAGSYQLDGGWNQQSRSGHHLVGSWPLQRCACHHRRSLSRRLQRVVEYHRPEQDQLFVAGIDLQQWRHRRHGGARYTDWPYAGPWTISTVTNSGGLQKVTTTAAHGLVTDMAVTVAAWRRQRRPTVTGISPSLIRPRLLSRVRRMPLMDLAAL